MKMLDDVGFVRKKPITHGSVYHIPVREGEYFKFKPADSAFGMFELGVVSCKDTDIDLGDTIPVDLGPYRDRLQEAYAKFVGIDAKYRAGSVTLDDSELDIMAEIAVLCEDIITPSNTAMGHA